MPMARGNKPRNAMTMSQNRIRAVVSVVAAGALLAALTAAVIDQIVRRDGKEGLVHDQPDDTAVGGWQWLALDKCSGRRDKVIYENHGGKR